MVKKILVAVILCFIVLGFVGVYAIKQHRQAAVLARQKIENAKAPDISITLLEGWSNEDIGNYLESKAITTNTAFLTAQATFNPTNYPLLSENPKGTDLQGFIFPDTYRIPKNPLPGSDINQIIIKKALDNFSLKITPELLAQIKANKQNLYDIIILASIIEKETGRQTTTAAQKQGLDEERKIIAGIFYNRLKISMALESDATINYITKKNQPAALLEDTKIDSPYNTYKYRGLPPGPISNPSLSSILSAIYPADTNYLYFLHDQTTGQAIYSKTYEEHLKNKQKYLD